jgi:hypothetical protein
MNPDRRMTDNIRSAIESEGDQLADLHLWRLGPGHLGEILSVVTPTDRRESFYRAKLGRFGRSRTLLLRLSKPHRANYVQRGNGPNSFVAVDLACVKLGARNRFPPRPCEKAMFKSLCGSGPEARLDLLAI